MVGLDWSRGGLGLGVGFWGARPRGDLGLGRLAGDGLSPPLLPCRPVLQGLQLWDLPSGPPSPWRVVIASPQSTSFLTRLQLEPSFTSWDEAHAPSLGIRGPLLHVALPPVCWGMAFPVSSRSVGPQGLCTCHLHCLESHHPKNL